jgi:hypothetical protein
MLGLQIPISVAGNGLLPRENHVFAGEGIDASNVPN